MKKGVSTKFKKYTLFRRVWGEKTGPSSLHLSTTFVCTESDRQPFEEALLLIESKEKITKQELTSVTVGGLSKDWFNFCRSKIRNSSMTVNNWEMFSWYFTEPFRSEKILIQVLIGWE